LGDLHGDSTRWILIQREGDSKNLPDNGKIDSILGWKLSWDLRTEVGIRNFSEKIFKISKVGRKCHINSNGSKVVQCLEALHAASKLDKEAEVLIRKEDWDSAKDKLHKGVVMLESVLTIDIDTNLITPALSRAKQTYGRMKDAHPGDDVSGILKSIDYNSHEKSQTDTYLYGGDFLKDLISSESSSGEHKPSNGKTYLDSNKAVFVSPMMEDDDED